MTDRHKHVLAGTSVLGQETNIPRLARPLQDTVNAEMARQTSARRASTKRLILTRTAAKKRQAT